MPDRIVLFRIGAALVAAAALMASGGAMPFGTSLAIALAGGAAIFAGLMLVQSRLAAGRRDYGYLAMGSLLVLVVFVILPSRSGGLIGLGLVSWAVVTVLAAVLIHYYRKTPLD